MHQGSPLGAEKGWSVPMRLVSLIGRFLAALAFYAVLCGIAYLNSTRAHAQIDEPPCAYEGMSR
jgi:hypothetical protein